MSIMNPIVASGIAQEFDQFFDSFSRDIIIHKEPKKILNSVQATNVLYGYDIQGNQPQYTFIPESKIFKARISYNKKQNIESLSELQFSIPQGSVTIVVKEEAKNYIENNKTLKIEFDEKAFKIVTTPAVRKFLVKTYYQYFLEETK